MPIRIPDDLPAAESLKREGVQLITQEYAERQDIRPLRIALLNLMPDKKTTELQLARLLGASPLQIELTLLNTQSHKSKNTDQEHLLSYYQSCDDVQDQYFDGLIVTGAPIETMAFEEVNYWRELTNFFDWTKRHVFSSFYICWGAQAAIHYFHRVPKHPLPSKRFGIFRHRNLKPADPLMLGINDDFLVPVSRHTEVRAEDLPQSKGLEVLSDSYVSGLCLVSEYEARRFYMFNHLEYDDDNLKREYERDIHAGKNIDLPINYYPNDDPNLPPSNRWRGFAHLLFGNWITWIYQNTSYDLSHIPRISS